MHDRQVSTTCAISYSLWALSIGLWVASVFIDERPLASAAVIAAIAAGTGTVRSYIVSHEQQMKSAMAVTSAITPVTELTPHRVH